MRLRSHFLSCSTIHTEQEISVHDFLYTGRDISVLFFKVTIFRNAPLELLFQFCLKRICGCFIKAIAARYTSCLSANLQNAFISFIFFVKKTKNTTFCKMKIRKRIVKIKNYISSISFDVYTISILFGLRKDRLRFLNYRIFLGTVVCVEKFLVRVFFVFFI